MPYHLFPKDSFTQLLGADSALLYQLARICEQKFGVPGEASLLCPTRRIAEQCRKFMLDRAAKSCAPSPNVRLVQFTICPGEDRDGPCAELHILHFPKDAFPFANQFWQHTGIYISSRLAERCLSLLGEDTGNTKSPVPALGRPQVKPGHRHHFAKSLGKSSERYGWILPREIAA